MYIQRHTVHCKGTSVSLDPFMLSADPNPKSMSKTQVKESVSVCYEVSTVVILVANDLLMVSCPSAHT